MHLLDRYEWEQTLMLALDDLSSRGQLKEAAQLIRKLSEFDLEAACRAVGRNLSLWTEVRLDLQPKIEHLGGLPDVNARWLAVRCAAASGQSDFRDLTWSAVPESQWDTSSPFVGLLPASILASFGPQFTERVLADPSEDARLLALQLVSAPTPAVISCLAEIADNDLSPEVRLFAVTKLVEFSAQGALRRLLREKRQIGRWNGTLLTILHQSPHLTPSRLAKLLRLSLATEENEIERTRIWRFWARHNRHVPGFSFIEMTKSEFTRVTSSSLRREEIYSRTSEFLNAVATIDPNWASAELTKRILDFGEIERLDGSVPEWLRPADREALIRHLIQTASCEDSPGNHQRSRILAGLDADITAKIVLNEVRDLLDGSEDRRRRRMFHDLLSEISRRVLLIAIANDTFSQFTKVQKENLIRVLSPDSAGAGTSATSLDADVRVKYRARLFDWLADSAVMDSRGAETLALLATLIGELEDPQDADALYTLLKAEDQRQETRHRERLQARNEQRPPTYDSLISWTHWHEAALGRVPGARSIAIHLEMLDDPRHVGHAAIALADFARASIVETSGGIGRRARYDLLRERPLSSEVPSQSQVEYCRRIRVAVEKHTVGRSDDSLPTVTDSAFRALYGVARLGKADDIDWILRRLEEDFRESTAEDLIEFVTLRGYRLDGRRILPTLKRTVKAASAPYQDHHQQAWRITKVLSALFFSDAPEAAILLLDEEVAWFRTTSEFNTLCTHLAHCLSPTVVSWLRSLWPNTQVRQKLSGSWWNAALQQARHLEDFDFLLSTPAMLAADGRATRLEAQAAVSNVLLEYATENPAFAERMLATAAAVTELDTAKVCVEILAILDSEQATLCIFALVRRFGSALSVLESLYPIQQQGSSMTFMGPFYLRRRVARFPAALDDLREFASHADPSLRLPAQRALLWLEREHLAVGSFSSGRRQGLPVESIELR